MTTLRSPLRRVTRQLALAAALLLTIGCDQATKRWASETLASEPPRTFWGDTVRLDYAENEGAFLGLGTEWPEPVRFAVFTVGNGLLLVGLCMFAIRQRISHHELLGTMLFVGGGISNLLDRVMDGRVVDFMNLGVGPVRTGIFNVADVAITAGVAWIVLAMSTSTRKSAAS